MKRKGPVSGKAQWLRDLLENTSMTPGTPPSPKATLDNFERFTTFPRSSSEVRIRVPKFFFCSQAKFCGQKRGERSGTNRWGTCCPAQGPIDPEHRREPSPAGRSASGSRGRTMELERLTTLNGL